MYFRVLRSKNMSVSDNNALEELRIQHALAAAGYYAYGVIKNLGSGEITVRARPYAPGDAEQLMADTAKRFIEPSENAWFLLLFIGGSGMKLYGQSYREMPGEFAYLGEYMRKESCKEKDMKKSAPFISYSRRPKARRAYFADVEKRTGLPMQGIVDSLAAQGLELRTCLDVPDMPPPARGSGPVYLTIWCEGVSALVSFAPPSGCAYHAKWSARRQDA
jgi:hypothetical protein